MQVPGNKTPAVLFTYRGDTRMGERELGREFEEELHTVLIAAGYALRPLPMTVVTTKAGGKKGLHIGPPRPNLYGVEVTWQGSKKGNDCRVSLLLSCPHGVDPGVFQNNLKKVVEARQLANLKTPKETPQRNNQPQPPEPVAKNVVNLFDTVPPAIMVPRGSEFDVIGLGVEDDEVLPQEQEPPKPPEPAPVLVPAQPVVTAVPSVAVRPVSSNLEAIAELTKTAQVEEALRAQVKDIDRQLGEIQTCRDGLDRQIVEVEDRRSKLARERNRLNVSLEAPEFSKARKELASIRQLLDKK